MKSRITFNGMNRYSPPNSAQPGDCTAIVNLRNQSNCLKPVGTPEYLYTPEKKNHRLVYVHICYNTTGSMIGAYEYTGESGMEPNVQQNSIRVFVSEDNLYVISDSFTVGYTIYNLSGSLQMKGEAVSGRPVDVSILPAGVYMVETNDRSGGIEFTKVLKNN